jgi:SAM-dependent methyltransferase
MFGDAEAYERFMGRWSRLIAPSLLEFADIPDAGRVLDVGSGTGSLAFVIADRKPRCKVVGIDPSKEYVAYATSRNRVGARAGFEIGDAQQLHFDDATFQSSLSLLVFNFIPDPGKALREVMRVTKPGGRIAAAVWDYGAGMRMLRTLWEAAVNIDPRAEAVEEKNMPLCHAGELSDLWKKAGLTSVDERPLDITMHFQSFADYWDPFLLGQGPAGAFVRRLERARLQTLRDEVKRRLHLDAEKAAFDLPARAWAVRGTVPSRSKRARYPISRES